MQKIIYIILGLVLLGSIAFGILYIRGNYNDKSKISSVLKENLEIKKEAQTTTKDEVGNLDRKENGKEEIKKVESKNNFLKIGSFNKIDPVHYASGEVKVSSDNEFYYINFQNNFNSANGPDLYVYLSSKQEYKNIAVGGVDTGRTLNIGKLKNISDAQVYKVSKEEFEKYSDSVIIWCKDFGIQFSRAELK